MSDEEFDMLVDTYGYNELGHNPSSNKVKHRYQMWSLMKVTEPGKAPFPDGIKTPKLDGAAISLLYSSGNLIQGATRGDGTEGEDITDKCYLMSSIPNTIQQKGEVQITGEVLIPKYVENSRNLASGSLHLKDLKEFNERNELLTFVAYDMQPWITETFTETLNILDYLGFTMLKDELSVFPTDGVVFRLDSNAKYVEAGFTAKHPKGAYALKEAKEFEIKETVLLDVIWQTGKSGRITPVAIFEPIVVEGATLERATLNNVGFIKDLDIEIGDTILITRSGGIIPKILGKVQ
jgi:DNA ligase (NAD+)